MKFLHIACDEKFIPFVQDSFEEVWPGENKFVILEHKINNRWRFVHSYGNEVVGDLAYFLLGSLKKDLIWCDMLIVHSLTELGAYAIKMAPEALPVFWSGWGADYYGFIYKNSNDLVLKKTEKLLDSCEKDNIKANQNVKSVLKNALQSHLLRNVIENAIPRVDFFSSPVPEDFYLLQHSMPSLKAQYYQINYSSNEAMEITRPHNWHGKDILVGNSATGTNNHVEIFELLKHMSYNKGKIVVPLSYGNESYKGKILEVGRELLGDRFFPLVDFMPLTQYNGVISNCSFVIMNHRRQQALGNILAMMYYGERVYLRPENTIFKFFSAREGHISDIQSLESDNNALVKLEKWQIDDNREIISRYFSRSAVISRIRDLSKLL